jgi:hypothetical protein
LVLNFIRPRGQSHFVFQLESKLGQSHLEGRGHRTVVAAHAYGVIITTSAPPNELLITSRREDWWWDGFFFLYVPAEVEAAAK